MIQNSIAFAPKYRRQIILWADQVGHWDYSKKIVRVQGGGDIESGSMPGSHPYAGKHPTKVQCITVYGISQRKKFADDIRQARKSEVQVWKPAILVPGILCGYRGQEQESDCGIYQKSAGRR